mmetsp:Transcript_6530/g.13140  ORF Transcript_6530/g.13140 Transcript_6530/m.13140 type:complete len:93 (-) Transcript_6530:14-292(-)
MGVFMGAQDVVGQPVKEDNPEQELLRRVRRVDLNNSGRIGVAEDSEPRLSTHEVWKEAQAMNEVGLFQIEAGTGRELDGPTLKSQTLNSGDL